jgi:hypothetical protein
VSTKRFLFALTTAGALFTLAAPDVCADLGAASKAYGTLLGKYVTPRGVKYDAWRADGADLKKIAEIAMIFRTTEPKPLPPEERKALYINLYNATILELVLFKNPKGSIKELSRAPRDLEIFSRAALVIDGKALSLNDLEKRLRDEFKDPRIHFAVNCASRSCPPIRPESYDPASLDGQLDDATRGYLASKGALQVITEGGKTRLVAPKIFDWYADDFKAGGGVLAFIAKYGPPDAAAAIAAGRVKLEFADYDWSLNIAK